MKSKIQISVEEENNQPCILIEYNESEDVRDLLVKKFLEKFGYTSSWAKVQYKSNSFDTYSKKLEILPISENLLQAESEIMTEQVRLNKEQN